MTHENRTLKQQATFTAREAAKEVGKSASTITRAISTGKLSANKNINGEWHIDASELFRAFPQYATQRAAKHQHQTARNGNDARKSNTETASEIILLELKLQHLNEKLESQINRNTEQQNNYDDLKNRLELAEKRYDDERADRIKVTALIANQNHQPTKEQNLLPWLLPIGTALALILAFIAYKVF